MQIDRVSHLAIIAFHILRYRIPYSYPQTIHIIFALEQSQSISARFIFNSSFVCSCARSTRYHLLPYRQKSAAVVASAFFCPPFIHSNGRINEPLS
ncbi:hypothetical protein CEXT_293191 [Caerostris extrusa]|uniref:Uncharacterized protein n=1 Tax=Caerostris extrusa TaxID=172846 RepID=A0AAV4T284_CAEEX|nr:hypothetical protein CEXT_293191 [Caerostris extrusa]